MASRRRKNCSLTTGMAIDGRASHLCHVCARDSARWYCAADEVYLCERCDTSVHNSNCISWRHERVRLGPSGLPVKLEHGLSSCSSSSGSSLKSASSAVKSEASTGLLVTNFSSRNGSQKRPRTSWGKPHASYATICSFVKEEIDSTAEESGVLREVPILLERWGSTMATEALHDLPTFKTVEQQLRTGSSDQSERPEIFPGFSRLSSSVEDLSSDEVISFVLPNDCCDVDSFLGDGFCDVDRGLRGILGEAVDADRIKFRNLLVPKIEEQEISESMSKELSTEISTDTSPDFSEEDYRIDLTDFEPEESSEAEGELKEEPVMKRLCLRLNYEDVLSAWSDRGSFWTDGRPPQTIPDDCTLDLAAKGWEMGFLSDIALGGEEVAEGEGGGDMAKVEEGEKSAEEGGNGGGGGAGREARVMRYREKRRTRLFSKKIRYEVRKLNAERRPRMKGRFVKRTLST